MGNCDRRSSDSPMWIRSRKVCMTARQTIKTRLISSAGFISWARSLKYLFASSIYLSKFNGEFADIVCVFSGYSDIIHYEIKSYILRMKYVIGFPVKDLIF